MKTVYAGVLAREKSAQNAFQNIFMDNANVDQRSWPVVTGRIDTEYPIPA